MKLSTVPKVGQRFPILGCEYEVCSVNAGQVRYAEVAGGKMHNISLEKFNTLLENHNILTDQSMDDSVSETPDLFTRSESEKDEMNRRLYYVRGAIERCEHPRSKDQAEPVLNDLALECGDHNPPSFSTYARWMKAFINGNRDPQSLNPQHIDKGNRQFRFEFIIEDIIHRRIKEDYLTEQRLSKKQVHQNIIGDILDEFSRDSGLPADIRLPSARTVSRRINALDPFLIGSKRNGKYAAKKSFKAAGRSLIASRILETVEADGNYMDILLVDPETGEIIGRPYATVLIDQYSRCIIAIIITMIPFSSATLLRAMSSAISSDNERPGGLFERIIVDNGSDYISNAVRNLCNTLGITIEHGAPRDPNSKALVERFFKTLNMGVIHLLPGTTFSNPVHKGDYDSTKKAAITLDELSGFVNEWLDNIYHKTLHTGHGRAPIQLWNESVQNTPVTSYSSADLSIIARSVEQRTISKGRVKVHGLQWYSHALSTLEHYLDQNSIKKVDVYIDELDLSHVYIKDPRQDGEFIQANSIKPEYTKDLSLYEHFLLREDLKSSGKKDLEKYTEKDLAIARWNLYKRINEHGKGYAKKRIARLKETQKQAIKQSDSLITPDQTTGQLTDDGVVDVFDNKSQVSSSHNKETNDALYDDDDFYDFEEI